MTDVLAARWLSAVTQRRGARLIRDVAVASRLLDIKRAKLERFVASQEHVVAMVCEWRTLSDEVLGAKVRAWLNGEGA